MSGAERATTMTDRVQANRSNDSDRANSCGHARTSLGGTHTTVRWEPPHWDAPRRTATGESKTSCGCATSPGTAIASTRLFAVPSAWGADYVAWLRNETADEILNSDSSRQSLLNLWEWRDTYSGAVGQTWLNMSRVGKKIDASDIDGAVRLVAEAIRRPRKKWATHLEISAARARLADHNVIVVIDTAGQSSLHNLRRQALQESRERGIDTASATYIVVFAQNENHYQYGAIGGVSRFDHLLRPMQIGGPTAGPAACPAAGPAAGPAVEPVIDLTD